MYDSKSPRACWEASKKLNIRYERTDAIAFINEFARQQGLVMPGRLPQFKLNTDLLILPSAFSKMFLFCEYVKKCEEAGLSHVSRPSWYRIWKQHCPNVVVQKPRTDLCFECQSNMTTIAKMAALLRDEKKTRVKECFDHLNRVKTERGHYHGVSILFFLRTMPVPKYECYY